MEHNCELYAVVVDMDRLIKDTLINTQDEEIKIKEENHKCKRNLEHLEGPKLKKYGAP